MLKLNLPISVIQGLQVGPLRTFLSANRYLFCGQWTEANASEENILTSSDDVIHSPRHLCFRGRNEFYLQSDGLALGCFSGVIYHVIA